MNERELDRKFEEMSISPIIYHVSVRRCDKIKMITIASHRLLEILNIYDAIDRGLKRHAEMATGALAYIHPGVFVKESLIARHIHGHAICIDRDDFSPAIGEIAAKGRLLKYLETI